VPATEFWRCVARDQEEVALGDSPVSAAPFGSLFIGWEIGEAPGRGGWGSGVRIRSALSISFLDGEPVDEIVHRITGMATHPFEGELIGSGVSGGDERLPDLLVLDGFTIFGSPVVTNPGSRPR